jgi:hypothetical protein
MEYSDHRPWNLRPSLIHLAGLLVNTTGGVNGTFWNVTDELPSLGLNSAVMYALATMTPEFNNSGVFGPPVSFALPHPPTPPSCSGLGCFFNTLSGVVSFVGQVVTGLVDIVGAVWTSVTAATQFMKQLAAGLAHLAEDAEQAAVAALATVGAAQEAALQALIRFVIAEVQAMINAILSGYKAMTAAFGTSVATALHQASIDEAATGGITTADGNNLANVIGGTYFQIGMVVTTTIIIVLTVLSAVSLGSSTLITLVIGAIVGAVLTLVLPTLVGSWGNTLFYDYENWINQTAAQTPMSRGGGGETRTSGCIHAPTSIPCDPSQLDWATWVSWLTWADTGVGTGYAAWALRDALIDPSFGWYLAEGLSLTFALMGAALTGLSVAGICDTPFIVSAEVFADAGVILYLLLLGHDWVKKASSWQVVLDVVTGALDGTVVGTNIY